MINEWFFWYADIVTSFVSVLFILLFFLFIWFLFIVPTFFFVFFFLVRILNCYHNELSIYLVLSSYISQNFVVVTWYYSVFFLIFIRFIRISFIFFRDLTYKIELNSTYLPYNIYIMNILGPPSNVFFSFSTSAYFVSAHVWTNMIVYTLA